MARAYQEAHILESLTSTMKQLQSQTADLTHKCSTYEDRIQNLTTAHTALTTKHALLETRMMANEHNSTARLANAHLVSSGALLHTPLMPLHDLGTNRPTRHFPKHERDVRVMGAADVIQVLQAVGVGTLGMTQAEKKGELRVQIGLPREGGKA